MHLLDPRGNWHLISHAVTERGVHDLNCLRVVQYTPSKHEALSWLLPIYVGPMIGGYFITTAYFFRTIAAANRDFAERLFEWETAGPGRGPKYDPCLLPTSNRIKWETLILHAEHWQYRAEGSDYICMKILIHSGTYSHCLGTLSECYNGSQSRGYARPWLTFLWFPGPMQLNIANQHELFSGSSLHHHACRRTAQT